MPTILNFKKNAIIYFKGDRPDLIYLIKEGKVTTISEKGDKNTPSTTKVLKKGEFFGLFSAIGQYPRQEDAVSVSDLELLGFDEEEFEDLVAKNSRLSLQLMKMLSQELRKVHKKTQKILKIDDNVELSCGLFAYIEMYVQSGDKEKAKYVIDKFLDAYPAHEKTEEVKDIRLHL